jgi:hypothetical protein
MFHWDAFCLKEVELLPITFSYKKKMDRWEEVFMFK